MSRLTSLEVYISIFFISNENIKFEISRRIEKEMRSSLEDLKFEDEIVCPQGLEDEILGPAVIDKLKKKWVQGY